MESAYRATFKELTADRKSSFLDKQQYRAMRRAQESSHTPFELHKETFEREDSDKENDSMGLEEQQDEGIDLSSDSQPSQATSSLTPDTPRSERQVPKLELAGRLTPSPPPRKQLVFGQPGVEVSVQTSDSRILKSRTTQTPEKWGHKDQNVRPVIEPQMGREDRSRRRIAHRTKPPFALYGHGDKERRTGTKRTFNIKASKRVYESALKAARNRNFARITNSRSLSNISGKEPCHRATNSMLRSNSWASDLADKTYVKNRDTVESTRRRFPLTEYQRQFCHLEKQ